MGLWARCPRTRKEAVLAAKKKDPEPVPVENLTVDIGDAHALLTADGVLLRLEPAQVAYLAKNLAHINNDLHVHSNA